jgi:hypothetical protein
MLDEGDDGVMRAKNADAAGCGEASMSELILCIVHWTNEMNARGWGGVGPVERSRANGRIH